MRPDIYQKQKGRISPRSTNRGVNSPNMHKLTFILAPLIFGLIFLVVAGFWWKSATTAPSASSEEVRFVITKGSSAEKIGKELAESGIIKSALAFKIHTQLNDKTRSIPPGEFNVPQNLGLDQVIDYLLQGPEEYWVTIPEGLRKEEIADKFIQAFDLDTQEASVFRADFLAESRNQEGYLFPDSYLFPPDITGSKAVARLTDTFSQKTAGEFTDSLQESELTLQEAVILASIIERESKTTEERPVVAGIYLNRLELGMPLQADATAQYAVANISCANRVDCDWWQTPTKADLETDSPYNTYQINDLPIAPIANPGIASLLAAVNPTDSDYLYYIHDDSGQIHYSATLAEHNANVQRYLR